MKIFRNNYYEIKAEIYFPIQNLKTLDNQVSYRFGQQMGNKII